MPAQQLPIYLDYAATTPVDEAVLTAMLPYFSELFGNAGSRQHAYGWFAADAVALAREQVAACIGASPKEIVFTSGATESINLALKGLQTNRRHIVTVQTEHKATLEVCRFLEENGYNVTYLPVNPDGTIDLKTFKESVSAATALVSVLIGNNETGVIHPVHEMAEIAHAAGAYFQADATQAVGKIPVSVNNLDVDLLSFSSHKLYGPKGVGALYVKKGTPVTELLHGGGQERSLRAGTLNVSGIVGFGKACELAIEGLQPDNERITALRDELEQQIIENLKNASVNASEANRLPHISNIRFAGVDGEELLMRLNKIAVSNGSACNSASTEPSHVLKAMGLSDDAAYASVRFSLGKYTTPEETNQAARHVIDVVNGLV